MVSRLRSLNASLLAQSDAGPEPGPEQARAAGGALVQAELDLDIEVLLVEA